jgi:hypothetical protein
LFEIKEGRAQECDATWLRDKDAFAAYQREYHESKGNLLPREAFDLPERFDDIDVAARMGDGMSAVVYGAPIKRDGGTEIVMLPRGGAHETVGEAVVMAVPRAEDNLFKYSHQNRFEASAFADSPPPGQGVVPPDFGSAALGAFSYYLLSPGQPGIGVIGCYFVEGRLGVLYAPLLVDQPETYPKVSLDAFRELVRLRHGIVLSGLVPSHG